MSEHSEDRLLRAYLQPDLDGMLAKLDGLDVAGRSRHVLLQRSNEVFLLTLTVQRIDKPEQSQPDRPTVAAPASNGIARPASRADRPAKLRRVHRKILEKATTDPMPVKVLLHKAGYRPNTYGRDAVTELVRWRHLIRLPEGVALPESA